MVLRTFIMWFIMRRRDSSCTKGEEIMCSHAPPPTADTIHIQKMGNGVLPVGVGVGQCSFC